MSPPADTEAQPLLGGAPKPSGPAAFFQKVKAVASPKKLVGAVLAVAFVIGTVVSINNYASWKEGLKDPHTAALYVLDKHPLIVSVEFV